MQRLQDLQGLPHAQVRPAGGHGGEGMRIFIQRPCMTVHAHYPEVGIMRAYPLPWGRVAVEIWANGDKEQGIDHWMENGIQTSLTIDQAKELYAKLGEAIKGARV